jgi:hypothetical protein
MPGPVWNCHQTPFSSMIVGSCVPRLPVSGQWLGDPPLPPLGAAAAAFEFTQTPSVWRALIQK